ncbi:MAG: hypothetical protein ACYCXA_15845 [Actinomycetes bacterium]
MGWSEANGPERHATVTVDTQGVIRSWDSGTETLFGYMSTEALGQSLDLIVPAELGGALPVHCADGEVRHFAGRLVVLLDGLGAAVGATVIFATTGTTGVRPFG